MTTPYTSTNLSLFAGQLGSNAPTNALYSINVMGSAFANGLTTSNQIVPSGYDITISGLQWNLGAGTYTLGVSTAVASNGSVSIGSGNGSAATIGSGEVQNNSLRTGDHMAFTVLGVDAQAVSVPEPGSVALVGLGLAGFAASRRKSKRALLNLS